MRERRALRLLHTLWYLRPVQIAGLLRRRLVKVRPVRLDGPSPRLRLAAPATPFPGPTAHAAILPGGRLRLLHRELDLGSAVDWDWQGAGALGRFHLHLFDWARHPALDAAERGRLLDDWVARHREGAGWQPAAISRRSFAWLKLLATPGALPDDGAARAAWLACWADQLATLEAHPERALLGNHYLWNLLALVLAGVALEGSRAERWLGHQARLGAELAQQVGADGAHQERSPMYHGLLLESLLDLINVARALPGRLSGETARQLDDTAARMLGALAVWTHPDGEIGLFGDAAFAMAQPPAVLSDYAARLGIKAAPPPRPGVLDRAGFARLSAGPFVLIASAAPPMPSHQPGHAHCDALSFELSVGGCRVVTDTGVTGYAPGRLRALSRATRSHATVEVDGRDQAELWAAHRIGARPDAGLVRVEPPGLAEGVCSSWSTPEVLHRRLFRVEEGAIRIEDAFDAAAPRARLFLPLAPGLEPRLAGCTAQVGLEGQGVLHIALPAAARWRVERTPCFPEFGLQQERATLVGEAAPLDEARWELRLEAAAATG